MAFYGRAFVVYWGVWECVRCVRCFGRAFSAIRHVQGSAFNGRRISFFLYLAYEKLVGAAGKVEG